MAEFQFIMHASCAVINSACAIQMLRCDGEHPTTLNILVPADCSLSLAAFVMDTLHYETLQNTQIHYSYAKVMSSHCKFQRGPLRITISEALTEDIFKVITSSHTTANMTVMTPGGITVLYPLWTLKGMAMTNHSVLWTAQGQVIGSIERQGWDIYTSSTFLKEPCARLCPTLWHNVADGDNCTLVIEWDHRFPMKTVVDHSKVMWQLSDQCANTECPYNTIINARACHLPPTPMPHNFFSIEKQKQKIEQHVPVRRFNCFSWCID
jgi:hypothetical protein